MFTLLKALFSFLAILFGTSIILWVLYNEFVERLPSYNRPSYAPYVGIGPIMLATGLYWARSLIVEHRPVRWPSKAVDKK